MRSVRMPASRLLQQHEILHEQARADEQCEREGNLTRHQAVSYASAGAAARPQIAFANHRRQLARAQQQKRPESAEDTDGERDDGGKEQHAPVDRDGRRARELSPGQDEERSEYPLRHRETEDAAGQREQHALGGQLAREIALPRAEREPNRQFTLARETRGEQQIGDIRAGDQQDEEHGAEQDVQRRAHGSDDRLGVRLDVHAMIGRELARERVAQRSHVGGGARKRHVRLQARERGQEMISACRRIELALQRNEHRRTPMREAVGHDADHLIGIAVEHHLAPDDARIAREALGPEVVGQDDDLRPAGLILLIGVPAANLRPHPKHLLQRRRRRRRADAHRLPASGQRERRTGRSPDRREHLVARLPVGVLRERGWTGGTRRLRVVHHHQLLGIGIRKRAQQDAVEDAEHGGRDADAQREGHDGQDRHETRANKRPRGDFQVEEKA